MVILIGLIVVSVLLSGAILIQGKGGGLGSSLNVVSSYHARRGMEKTLFNLTVILAVIFTVLCILALR